MDFYILSLKWTRGDVLMWWRPKNSGYTVFLESAGKYTAEQVAADPAYYNDGVDTAAVPAATVDAASGRLIGGHARHGGSG
jgi:hypothetical protein